VDANGRTVGVTGLATISGGEYKAGSATQTFDGGLKINGGTFTGSTGTVDVNGTLEFSSGTLTAPSGNLQVSGDWNRTGGAFNANGGTVLLDGNNQTIYGDNNFNNLSKIVTNAYTLTLGAGKTQTIGGTLTLRGATGQLLSLVSTDPGVPGTQWMFSATAVDMESLNIRNSQNTGPVIDLIGKNCVDGGNNLGFKFALPPVPNHDAEIAQGEKAVDETFNALNPPAGQMFSLPNPFGGPVLDLDIGPIIEGLRASIPAMDFGVPNAIAAMPVGPVTVSTSTIAPAPMTEGPVAVVQPGSDFEGVAGESFLPPPAPASLGLGEEQVDRETFEGAASEAELPGAAVPEAFEGIRGESRMPAAVQPVVHSQPSFEGVVTEVSVPQPVDRGAFEGVRGEARMRIPLQPDTPQPSFKGAMTEVSMPQPIDPGAFEGAFSSVELHEPVTQGAFEGVSGEAMMPEALSEFSQLHGEIAGSLSFPGGRGLVTSFGVGATSGAEKPSAEPNVQDKNS
jgi:hypothetical protein